MTALRSHLLRRAACAVLAAAGLAWAQPTAQAGMALRSYARVAVDLADVATNATGGAPGDAVAPVPVRYSVPGILSGESSAFGRGVLLRFELPDVPPGRAAVVSLDLDVDALRQSGALRFAEGAAQASYHEVAAMGSVVFVPATVTGEVWFLDSGSADFPPGAVPGDLTFGFSLTVTSADRRRTVQLDNGVARAVAMGAAERPRPEPDMVVIGGSYETAADCSGTPILVDSWDDDDDSWDDGYDDSWDDGYDDSWDDGYDDASDSSSWDDDSWDSGYDGGDACSGDDTAPYDDGGGCGGGGEESTLETDCMSAGHPHRRGKGSPRGVARLWPLLGIVLVWASLRRFTRPARRRVRPGHVM